MFVQPCTLAVPSPLLQAVWDAVAADVVSLYERLSAACVPGPHLDQLHDRALKHLLLSIIVAGAATPSVFTSRVPSPVTATVNVRAPACLTQACSFAADESWLRWRGWGDGVFVSGCKAPLGLQRAFEHVDLLERSLYAWEGDISPPSFVDFIP